MKEVLQNSELDRRRNLVGEIDRVLRQQEFPFTFLVYGSTARGVANGKSDIDTLLIFRRQDIQEFVNNKLLFRLGLSDKEVFTPQDISDLETGKIDFLRLAGKIDGIEVELQFFPLDSVKKACDLRTAYLISGKKSCEEKPNIGSQNPVTIVDTFRGETFLFEREPVLNGERIDLKEVGFINYGDNWSRTINLAKFVLANTVSDSLEVQGVLDDIMQTLVRTTAYYSNLYEREGEEIVGLKREILNPRHLLDLFSFTRKEGERKRIEMSEEALESFTERYQLQVDKMLKKYNWSIYE